MIRNDLKSDEAFRWVYCSPENNSNNPFLKSCDYTITLIKRKKTIISYLRIECFLYFRKKLEFLSPKDGLHQVWLKLKNWFWRRFINFANVFLVYHYFVDFKKKRQDPSFEQTWILSPKNLIWIWPSSSWEDLFVWVFRPNQDFFHSYKDITITGEGLQNLTLTQHLWHGAVRVL